MNEKLDLDLLDDITEMFENGCGSIEILEYIEDNTDLDPCLYIEELF